MATMNELKAVHMPSEVHREFRSLVKYQKTLDSRSNKMKCTIWAGQHASNRQKRPDHRLKDAEPCLEN